MNNRGFEWDVIKLILAASAILIGAYLIMKFAGAGSESIKSLGFI